MDTENCCKDFCRGGGYALLPKQLYDTSQMANVKAYRIVDALKTSVGFAWPRAGAARRKPRPFFHI